jgi:hypothetical protein
LLFAEWWQATGRNILFLVLANSSPEVTNHDWLRRVRPFVGTSPASDFAQSGRLSA